jgi:hypothetical protein
VGSFADYGQSFPRILESENFKPIVIDEKSFPSAMVSKNVLFPPVLSPHPLATNYRKVFFAIKPSSNESLQVKNRRVQQCSRSRGSEEIVIVQCSIVICHRRWRFAQSFLKNDAPKAHPKMTNDS